MNTILTKITEYKVYILIILTLCLMVINHLFYIDDYISVPQFAHFEHWGYCMEEILFKRPISFYSYFVLDSIWSIFLLWTMYEIVSNYCCIEPLQKQYIHTPIKYLTQKWVYKILFIATWLSDFGENISYIALQDNISVHKGYLADLVAAKIALYAICFLFFLIVLYKKYIKSNSSDLLLFWKSSLLSLLFLSIIAILLTQMEQGSSLVIALLDSPFNMLLVLLMLINLSIVFAHYPVYILFFYHKKDHGNHGIWQRESGCCKGGIIQFAGMSQVGSWTDYDKKYKNYRYFLGALVFISFIYALFFTFDKYIINPSITFKVVLIVTASLFGIKYYFEKLESDNIQRLRKIYLINYGLSWVFFLLTIISSYFFGWHWSTFILTFVFLLTKSAYTFLNRKNEKLGLTFDQDSSIFKFLFKVHKIEFGDDNSHIRKLIFIKWSGIIAIAIFALSHFPCIGMQINPILIILCYVHIAYGFVIILLKNYLYYDSLSVDGPVITFSGTLSFISKNTIVVLLILFGYKYYWNRIHNEIQYLKEYAFDKKKTIEIDTFIKDYITDNSNDSVRYYIASWGGGLRATYFNLLYLDKKQKDSTNTFLSKVVAMSGVSGGSLGLNLFFSAKKENVDKGETFISDLYDEIGNGNFASTDLAYLLGRDRLPFNQWLSRDRSIVGMNNYWSIITSPCTTFDTTTYQTYWKEGVDRRGYFPLLITNTTKTSGNYGVAFSAYASKEKFDAIFKGATNILELENSTKSLSFYEAMSTTERFPFFSATASIRGQGHYIDGGYFENSGILSIINLRAYINDKTGIKGKDSLIILGNSKSNTIDFYLSELQKEKPISIKLNGETDYGAILKGISDTDRLGNYLSDHYGVHSSNAKRINLPYHLRYRDFVGALGGEPKNEDDIDSIRNLIEKNNELVDKAILDFIKNGKPNINHRTKPLSKWDFAYPTLSRYLSRPTVNYYKAMFKYHRDLQ